MVPNINKVKQIIIIFSGVNGYLDDLEVGQIKSFCSSLLTLLKSSKPAYAEAINSTKKLESATEEILKEAILSTKENIQVTT